MAIIRRFSGLACSATSLPRMNSVISTGTRVTDSRAAAAIDKVLVSANGVNMRPS